MILFDTALLVKKTRCGLVVLTEVLNNYALNNLLINRVLTFQKDAVLS